MPTRDECLAAAAEIVSRAALRIAKEDLGADLDREGPAFIAEKAVMASPGLNTTQLEVLKWMNDGCPSDVYSDYSHRVTARALERRGFVEIADRGAAWTASVTPSGRAILDGTSGPFDDTQSRVSRVIQGLIDGNGKLLLHEGWSYPQADGVKGKALQSALRPHGSSSRTASTDTTTSRSAERVSLGHSRTTRVTTSRSTKCPYP